MLFISFVLEISCTQPVLSYLSGKVVSGKNGSKREMPRGKEVLCKLERELYHLPPTDL